jgi:hypothetical protein
MGIASRFNSTAVHKRKSRSTDSRGGQTFTFATETTALPCRVSMKGSLERERADREEGLGNYLVFVGPSATVKVHDTLTVGSLVYEVVGISRPSRGLHLELDAELVEPGA